MISILLVDDEVQFREVTRMFLERGRGIRVVTATSGDQALQILKEQSFDAIISDYAMPGMNGIDFMKQVKGMGDDTPFIIFTGKGREDVVIDALNFGADLYLEKGPDPRSQFGEMMQKVRNMVSLRADIQGEKEKIGILNSVMKRFPGMIFRLSHSTDATFLFASAGAELLTGYSARDIVSGVVEYNALISPDDLQKVTEARGSAVGNGEYHVTYHIVSRMGIRKCVRESGSRVSEPGEFTLEGYIIDLGAICPGIVQG